MSTLNGRKRRKLVPLLAQLESRRLLTVSVTWIGQDGADLVGPTNSPGPDGIQDVHLQLASLQSVATSESIQSIVIQGPPGFEWEYNNNGAPQTPAWAKAEFFFPYRNPTDWSQGDLYLNPIVDSNLGPSGNPLGSSTGAPITLQNGDVLSLTVTYLANGITSTDTGSTTVSSLVSPPLPMPPTATPGDIVTNSFSVSWSQFANNGQDGTYVGPGPDSAGYVHLRVSGLQGRQISFAALSDQAGMYWNSNDTSYHQDFFITNDPAGSDTADLYFPPTRDESVSVPGFSAAAAMTLRLNFSGDANQYVTQFAGGPLESRSSRGSIQRQQRNGDDGQRSRLGPLLAVRGDGIRHHHAARKYDDHADPAPRDQPLSPHYRSKRHAQLPGVLDIQCAGSNVPRVARLQH